MKKALVVAVALFSFVGLSYGGSIILPFWQNDGAVPIYTMFIILNTSTSTNDLVNIMFYGATNNPQSGTPIEKTISNRNLEIFGTGAYPGALNMPTGDPLGYAIASETGGMLVAVGIVYDANARAGYPIPCFQGGDDLQASNGW